MTDGDALLAAVLANPADDTVRLVYADWLREHGDAERADFIQIQCELASWQPPRSPWCPVCGRLYDDCPGGGHQSRWPDEIKRRRDLREREQELLTLSRREEWFPMPGLVAGIYDPGQSLAGLPIGWAESRTMPPLARGIVRRGFVESVTTSAETWVAHGDAVRAKHPVEKVTLTTEPLVVVSEPTPLRTATPQVGLMGDPKGVNFSQPAFDTARRAITPPPTRPQRASTIQALALLSLRWPGAAFTLPEPAPLDDTRLSGGYFDPVDYAISGRVAAQLDRTGFATRPADFTLMGRPAVFVDPEAD